MTFILDSNSENVIEIGIHQRWEKITKAIVQYNSNESEDESSKLFWS